jgi:hypothetical protein
VTVFSHTLAQGLPTPLAGLDQGAEGEGLAGVAETGDQFGAAIDMTNFRPGDQTYNSDALLAIGAPGEAIGSVGGAGTATVIRVQPSGAYTEVAAVDPSKDGVEGDPTANDHFGQRLTIANLDTSVVTSDATVRLAVGIPGREVGTVGDAGAVQLFHPLSGSIGSTDKVVTRAADGSVLPGTASARDFTGMSLTSGSVNLYVGVPFSKGTDTSKGVLYVLPWAAAEGSSSTSTTTFRPGVGGIPDVGTSFGVVG